MIVVSGNVYLRHAGPCAGIHVFFFAKTWMAGTSPAMTSN
jgi:hypothetical protein